MSHCILAPPELTLQTPYFIVAPLPCYTAHLHLPQVTLRTCTTPVCCTVPTYTYSRSLQTCTPPAGKVTVDTCTSSRSDCTPVLHLRSHCTLPLACPVYTMAPGCCLATITKVLLPTRTATPPQPPDPAPWLLQVQGKVASSSHVRAVVVLCKAHAAVQGVVCTWSRPWTGRVGKKLQTFTLSTSTPLKLTKYV